MSPVARLTVSLLRLLCSAKCVILYNSHEVNWRGLSLLCDSSVSVLLYPFVAPWFSVVLYFRVL